ncbi:maleate cis-trans isomerase family protein [Pseudodonghicola flavimaris]|uniref:Asp/Glu racemase n=1 Tax=Pseudodonghicola flavimaris TaxID=3050036 RepID=A0ABT7F1C3_9RHOB|nr:Asp/Glu racemase [Pseudodonghicola flavimaris]MDK3018305.1 Asp/Glu racemase [Pseudodonghicola flavimaris]
MQVFGYDSMPASDPALGLIVLQVDERIERDFRRLMPEDCDLLVSRVPSGLEVSPESLAEMEEALPRAAALFPRGRRFDVIGYGCTSGTAQIGAARVAAQIRAGARADHVTDPLSALIAACRHLRLRRLALLSPYVASVSDRLRGRLAEAGIATPVFGSFAEAEEARVARIAPVSVLDAGRAMLAAGPGADVDGLFLSCTNLATLSVIPALEEATGLPVLSSNLVLAWDMLRRAGAGMPRLDCRLTRGGGAGEHEHSAASGSGRSGAEDRQGQL